MSFTSTLTTAQKPVRRISLMRMFSIWASLYRQRSQLGELSSAQLKDIGIDEIAAKSEAKRPVWDVPQIWLQ